MPYKLLADLGNSRLKWARREIGQPWPETRRIDRGQSAPAEMLQKAWRELPPPDSIWVASVLAPADEAPLVAFCENKWPAAPVHFPRTPARGGGMVSAYSQPESMGVDRWLALAAARDQCKTAVCVADIGTAVTLDAMDASGNHLGGLIAPGLTLARAALARGTERLRGLGTARLVRRADNTADAVYSGMYWAVVSLIERFSAGVETELAQTVTLFLTGGDADVVQGSLSIKSRVEPDLVLLGLDLISK